MSNLTAIVRIEATNKVDPTQPLEDRFRAAFAAVQHHWMVTDKEIQYRAAIEAVYLSATDEEQQRILDEAAALRDLNALISGLPVDPERMATPPEAPIGMLKLWHEACEAA